MVYCAVVGCYNHSNKTNTTEKISYFHVPSDESLHRIWLSIYPLKFCLRLFYSMVLMYTGILSRILLKFLVIFSHILKNQEQLFSRNTFQWLLLKNCKANHLTGFYTMQDFTERYFRTDYNTAEAATAGVLQK